LNQLNYQLNYQLNCVTRPWNNKSTSQLRDQLKQVNCVTS